MIKTKHFLDEKEADDGPRVWIEPIGLTIDLQEWCTVDAVLNMLAPPLVLCEWFEAHPDEYEEFRGRFHEWLSKSSYRVLFQQLARDSLQKNITFLHGGDDPDHNCATALKEFIGELEAYILPDD